VLRTSWIDIDGISRSVTGQGNPGQLWLGSGIGPTIDGGLGIDVSAPGNTIVTTYSPTSHWATFRNNLIQGGNGLYGMASAVSAASPIVTGIIALMLQMKPDLDAFQIKQILQESARSDAFTGTTPNTYWGYGKVDAFNALTLVKHLTDVKDKRIIINNFSLGQNYPNPFNPTTTINYSLAKEGNVKLTIYNSIGSKVATIINENKPSGNYTVQFNERNLASGIYFYRIQAGSFVETKKMILLK
jgi:hypothetical protein